MLLNVSVPLLGPVVPPFLTAVKPALKGGVRLSASVSFANTPKAALTTNSVFSVAV